MMSYKRTPYLLPTTLVLIAISLISCGKRKSQTGAGTAFYYWQTTAMGSSQEEKLADSLKVNALYVRYLDVDWDEGVKAPVPVGELSPYGLPVRSNTKLIPVFFITNKVMQKLPESQLQLLAEKLHERFTTISAPLAESFVRAKFPPPNGKQEYDLTEEESTKLNKQREEATIAWLKDSIAEVQFDCDWTPSTKDKYFSFLQKAKSVFKGQKISTTVRLWQFKNREKAGIPPADRGTLMCYNVSDPRNPNEDHSIGKTEDVAAYLKNTDKYPIPLDAALPLFQWTAIFHGEQFVGFSKEFNLDILATESQFKSLGNNKFQFLRDTVIGRTYIREGDIARLETVSEESLVKMRKLLDEEVLGKDSRVIFFDWNSNNIKRYNVEKLREIGR